MMSPSWRHRTRDVIGNMPNGYRLGTFLLATHWKHRAIWLSFSDI